MCLCKTFCVKLAEVAFKLLKIQKPKDGQNIFGFLWLKNAEDECLVNLFQLVIS